MPPLATDTQVDAATRRLRSLRVIDVLTEQLAGDPHNPEIYFALGQIYYYSLENPLAAQRHFCGAVLHDVRNNRFSETIRFVWLSPGLEESLEKSLRPAYRRLPWAALRDSVLAIKGLDDRQRARLFMDGLDVFYRMSKVSKLSEDRVRWAVNEPQTVLREWALEDSPDAAADIWTVVVVDSKYRKRVEDLNTPDANGSASPIWMVRNQHKQHVIFRKGGDSIATLLSLLVDRSLGRNAVVYIFAAERQLVLRGRLSAAKFQVLRFAARPNAIAIRRALNRESDAGAKGR